MKNRLRLKDLDNISQEGLSKINFEIIMKEVLGYRDTWFLRKKRYSKALTKAVFLVEQARRVSPNDIIWDHGCPIKKPNHVDFISFQAMMELQSLLGSEEDRSMGEMITDIITIVCYSVNVEKHYNSESDKFKQFRQHVGQQELFAMLGLYNWISESLLESNKTWTQRFFEVEILDPDFENAGGSRMGQFNIISTIKSICNDFNVTYDEAWQMSYSLTQTNSYSKAVQNHIQDTMRKDKEVKMRAQREQS